jgi:hypothetical protein
MGELKTGPKSRKQQDDSPGNVNPNFRIRANLEDNDDPLSRTNKLLPREVTMNSWKFSLASPQDRCVPVSLRLLCAALSLSIVGQAADATKSRGNLIHKRRVGLELERSLVGVVLLTFCLHIISRMGHMPFFCSPGLVYHIRIQYLGWGPSILGRASIDLSEKADGAHVLHGTIEFCLSLFTPDASAVPTLRLVRGTINSLQLQGSCLSTSNTSSSVQQQ